MCFRIHRRSKSTPPTPVNPPVKDRSPKRAPSRTSIHKLESSVDINSPVSSDGASVQSSPLLSPESLKSSVGSTSSSSETSPELSPATPPHVSYQKPPPLSLSSLSSKDTQSPSRSPPQSPTSVCEEQNAYQQIYNAYSKLHGGTPPPSGLSILEIAELTARKVLEVQYEADRREEARREAKHSALTVTADRDAASITFVPAGAPASAGPSSAPRLRSKSLHAPSGSPHPPTFANRLRSKSLHKTHEPRTSWLNWNRNQKFRGKMIAPTTLEEMQEAVRDAAKVRVAAYGHSWSPIVATEEDSLETTLINVKGVFSGILSTREDVIRTKNVTFECGVSIQMLEDWIRKEDLAYTVAANVVLTEVYMVGVTAALCHGAGYEWGSIADFVRAVTIIEANGDVKTYTDLPADQVSIPADSPLYSTITRVDTPTMNHYKGTLGLLGVIYAMTVELVEDHTLTMTDKIVSVDNLTDASKLKALVEEHNGWVEVFWVPASHKVWVKSWKRAPEGTVPKKPDHAGWDFFTTTAGKALYKSRQDFQRVGIYEPRASRTYMELIYSFMVLGITKKGTSHNWKWYDAVHYRNKLDEFRVEDTEFAFPVDADYETPAAAFSHVKQHIDEHAARGEFPVDIVVEIRFTAGSHATLAHFPATKSDKWAHIEFLSFAVEGLKKLQPRWHNFVQEVTPGWQDLGGLPHWAKGWHNIQGIDEYIAKNMVPQEFRDERKKVDPTGKFLNTRLAGLFGEVGEIGASEN